MSTDQAPTRMCAFRLPVPLRDAAKVEAEARGESLTDVVVRALESYTAAPRVLIAAPEMLDEQARRRGMTRQALAHELLTEALLWRADEVLFEPQRATTPPAPDPR